MIGSADLSYNRGGWRSVTATGEMDREKRRYRRFHLTDVRGNLLLSLDARIRDISLSGMALESSTRLDPHRSYSFRLGSAEAPVRVVGTVVATHDGRKGWVNRVAVEERLRRRGLGARLVRAAEAWLEAQGMDILACLVEAGNAVSMAVFGKLGYTKHPEIVYFAKRRFPGA